MLYALLLIFPCNGTVWVNLSRCRLLHRHWYLMEALQQRIAFEVIVQQHASQIGMAGKLDTEHVIGFTFQPVRSWPDRNHTIHRSEERRVGKECRSRWSP